MIKQASVWHLQEFQPILWDEASVKGLGQSTRVQSVSQPIERTPIVFWYSLSVWSRVNIQTHSMTFVPRHMSRLVALAARLVDMCLTCRKMLVE